MAGNGSVPMSSRCAGPRSRAMVIRPRRRSGRYPRGNMVAMPTRATTRIIAATRTSTRVEPAVGAERPPDHPLHRHLAPHGQAAPTAWTRIFPDGLTQTSRLPVAVEFWTRSTPLAVAAPSALNVIAGPQRDARSVLESSPARAVGGGADIDRSRATTGRRPRSWTACGLFGFVCVVTVCEMPRVTASDARG